MSIDVVADCRLFCQVEREHIDKPAISKLD
jgi:hypothetical protein